jgi:hypothetical protein
VSWALRFLAWASALSVPCWWMTVQYKQLLALAANWAVGMCGLGQIRISPMEVCGPFDIGLFVAMTLASSAAPASARLRALLAGPVILAALACAAAIVTVADVHFVPRMTGDGALANRLVSIPVATTVFMSPVVAWVALVGKWEIGLRVKGE